jgi:hypothetical protein
VRKLAEFVADHFWGDEDVHKHHSVVDGHLEPHELRDDRGFPVVRFVGLLLGGGYDKCWTMNSSHDFLFFRAVLTFTRNSMST